MASMCEKVQRPKYVSTVRIPTFYDIYDFIWFHFLTQYVGVSASEEIELYD